MKRYDPNPSLVAPSSQPRMIEAVSGDYVLLSDVQPVLTRLVSAAQAMRREIVDRIEPDADGFQPYDGDLEVWTEFCEATEAATI